MCMRAFCDMLTLHDFALPTAHPSGGYDVGVDVGSVQVPAQMPPVQAQEGKTVWEVQAQR